ncbi:hypothetical protein [Streptomyces atratus]|uniref:hypothetical protein n=1 Tax=Streptomyces atratus TaxID=1893 RepID=UPI00340E34A2
MDSTPARVSALPSNHLSAKAEAAGHPEFAQLLAGFVTGGKGAAAAVRGRPRTGTAGGPGGHGIRRYAEGAVLRFLRARSGVLELITDPQTSR